MNGMLITLLGDAFASFVFVPSFAGASSEMTNVDLCGMNDFITQTAMIIIKSMENVDIPPNDNHPKRCMFQWRL